MASYLAVISYPIVKLQWYDAPLYPLYALLSSIGLTTILSIVEKRWRKFRWAFPLILALIFYVPFTAITDKNKNRIGVDNHYEREGFTMRKLARVRPQLNQYKVLLTHGQNAHYTHVEFYLSSLNDYQGYEVELMKSYRSAAIGDTILCCQPKIIDSLSAHFHVESIYSNDVHCQLFVVDSAHISIDPE